MLDRILDTYFSRKVNFLVGTHLTKEGYGVSVDEDKVLEEIIIYASWKQTNRGQETFCTFPYLKYRKTGSPEVLIYLLTDGWTQLDKNFKEKYSGKSTLLQN